MASLNVSYRLHPYSSRAVCISTQHQGMFSPTKLCHQRPCRIGPIRLLADPVDTGVLLSPRARSPLLVASRRSRRQRRAITVRSSTVAPSSQVDKQCQARDVGPFASLVLSAAAGLLLSTVIDGKGLMLATYWAARYFVPAVVSLWMAKQVRKRYYAVTAVVVMAANYAAFTAVLNRLLVGATTTVKLYYPLFSGNVTIPRVVAKWIRHNNHVAKFLTKTLAFGPWVLLSLAAALQLAVWLDAKGRHNRASDTSLLMQASEGVSCQTTPSPQPASASTQCSPGSMSKKAESAGPELEKAGAIAHQGDQQSSTANGPAQAKDIKASREQLSSVDVPQLNRLSEPSAGDCQSKDVSQEEDVDEKGDCYNSYDADRDGSDEEEETEDSDETAKDIDTGEEEESAKRVGGDGDFSDLTVCSTLHGVMRIEFALQYQKPALTLYDILAKNKQELLT